MTQQNAISCDKHIDNHTEVLHETSLYLFAMTKSIVNLLILWVILLKWDRLVGFSIQWKCVHGSRITSKSSGWLDRLQVAIRNTDILTNSSCVAWCVRCDTVHRSNLGSGFIELSEEIMRRIQKWFAFSSGSILGDIFDPYSNKTNYGAIKSCFSCCFLHWPSHALDHNKSHSDSCDYDDQWNSKSNADPHWSQVFGQKEK